MAARQANFHGHDGIEDVVVATLTLEGGGVATLTSVWDDVLARPSLRRVEVFCERRGIATPNPDGDFVRAARDGGPAHPDVRVALRAHRLVDAAYRSAATGGAPVNTPATTGA